MENMDLLVEEILDKEMMVVQIHQLEQLKS